MQIRYDWHDGIMDTIDWEAHRQATHSQIGRKTHYIKLCHNILPTGSVVCKYGQCLPDYCSVCRQPNEDFQHILRCTHPSCSKWRNSLLLTLTKLCHSIRTDPTLISILLDGFKIWLSHLPLTTHEYPSEYHTLIQEQNAIGWDHCFQGRISLRWAQTQQDY